jgi:hypothetical protein
MMTEKFLSFSTEPRLLFGPLDPHKYPLHSLAEIEKKFGQQGQPTPINKNESSSGKIIKN